MVVTGETASMVSPAGKSLTFSAQLETPVQLWRGTLIILILHQDLQGREDRGPQKSLSDGRGPARSPGGCRHM